MDEKIDLKLVAKAVTIPLKTWITFREVMIYLDKEKSAAAKFLSDNCIRKNEYNFYSRVEIDDVLNGEGKIQKAVRKIKI
jgi:hypothetical protein